MGNIEIPRYRGSLNKMTSKILIWCLLLAGVINNRCSAFELPVVVNAEDSVLYFPFGNNNSIVYHCEDGRYDVQFSGGIQIRDANAIAGTVDTAQIVQHIYGNSAMNYAGFEKTPVKSAVGTATVFKVYRKSKTGVRMEQDFTVFRDKEYFFTKVRFYNINNPVNYCSPLSAGTVELKWEGSNYALRSPFDNDMWATYETKMLNAASFTSSEVSVIFNKDRKGFVIGSLEHEVWKSGVQLQSISDKSFKLTAFGGFTNQRITHDQLPHGNVQQGEGSVSSPLIMVGYFGDWRQGMKRYATNNRLTEPPFIESWKGSTPIGWNSWGVIQDKIDLPTAKGVIDFFADSCKVYRTKDKKLFIDLDSYWDRMISGGLDGNVNELKAFVDYCNAKGFEPGIYWAPFTDWGKQPDRKVEGSTYIYQNTWTSVNGQPIDIDGGRAMDPTHPGTRERIIKYINFFKSLGFKMIKIDFLGHATLEADHYYDDRIRTGMEAFRSGMEFLDSLLDNKMLVYAAISPNLATARYVHMRRIACDAFKSISETAYTLNSVTYGWWQGHIYDYIDADHVVFKGASPGENRARLASAVVTGSLITGDDYSAKGSWRQVAQHLLQNKGLLGIVDTDGKPFRPCSVEVGQDPSNFFEKRVGNKIFLAVFNYGNNASSFWVSYAKLGITKLRSIEKIMGPDLVEAREEGGKIAVKLPMKDAIILQLNL